MPSAMCFSEAMRTPVFRNLSTPNFFVGEMSPKPIWRRRPWHQSGHRIWAKPILISLNRSRPYYKYLIYLLCDVINDFSHSLFIDYDFSGCSSMQCCHFTHLPGKNTRLLRLVLQLNLRLRDGLRKASFYPNVKSCNANY
jgi:hypothetical protein